jgi:hypothetical protein
MSQLGVKMFLYGFIVVLLAGLFHCLHQLSLLEQQRQEILARPVTKERR